jgi:cell division septation protein DedD
MEPVYNARMQRRYASDRRAHVRRSLPVAELELSDSVGGSVLDISEAGMAVQGVSRLTPENFSKVRFRLPDSASWIETSCKVAWMSDAQDVVGVEFENLGDLERAQIRSWSDRLAKPEPWAKDSGAPRRTITMELPLSPVPAAEEPLFRSESWVRERATGSYDRAIVIVVVIALAAAAVLFAMRSGWPAKLFESRSNFAPATPSAPGADNSDPGTSGTPADAAPAVPFDSGSSRAQERAANARASSVSPASDQEFIVQVGAMRVRGNADALANKLQAQKFPTLQFVGRENLNVVGVGPFTDEASAREARQELHQRGFDGIIRSVPVH